LLREIVLFAAALGVPASVALGAAQAAPERQSGSAQPKAVAQPPAAKGAETAAPADAKPAADSKAPADTKDSKAAAEPQDAKAAADAKATQEAKAGAKAGALWLEVVDAGLYAASWNDLAAVFRGGTSPEKWAEIMSSVRGPLGKPLERRLKSADYSTSLPGAPPGEYVTVVYNSRFENVPPAHETLLLAKDRDGQWRVAGYAVEQAPDLK
jgi:hypothetical protein